MRALAHPYETDILEITFDRLSFNRADIPLWQSALYALLEGASNQLDINRDDIDGTLYPKPAGQIALVIFDAVPGGAGGAKRISRAFPDVLAAAHHESPAATVARRLAATAACGTTAISRSTNSFGAGMP